MNAARPATPSSGVGALRSASSTGIGWPSRSRIVSSSTRSGVSTARPRSRPSRKSTFWRARPEYGERRNAIEIGAATAEPREAQQTQERLAVRRLVEAGVRLERIGHAEGLQRRLQRRLPAVERRADDPDLFGGDAGPQQAEQLFADELERTALPGALEEPDRAVDRRPCRPRVGEQRALEVHERRLGDLLECRRQFLDAAVGERAEIFQRAPQRREGGTAWLVRHRHGDLPSPGERLQQCPFRSGQIFEAVREDRLAGPGVQLTEDAVRRVTPEQVAVPEPEAVELRAVRGVQGCELAVKVVRVEQARFELTDGREQRVGEAAEPRRGAEAVERVPGERATHDQSALRLGRDGSRLAATPGDADEEVVERDDRAPEQSRSGPRAVRARALRRPTGSAR